VIEFAYTGTETPYGNTDEEKKGAKEFNPMKREEIYKEIKEMFGVVPGMFKSLPDSSLEMEWRLFRRVQFDGGPIPNKYRELIGVAISAVSKCKYCSFFHTEAAKLNGATDAEIEDAVHFAKSSAGWSTYINGMQLDYEQFKKEIRQVSKHVRSMQKKKK
jgi:AhpD family alkylhydroperoxidase